MTANTDRIEQFEADVVRLGVDAGPIGRERLLAKIGAALLITGPIVAIVAWFLSHGTSDVREQRDALVAAVIGLSLAVSGAALFLRYSLAEFLRFWMLRLVHEQRGSLDPGTGRGSGVGDGDAEAG